MQMLRGLVTMLIGALMVFMGTVESWIPGWLQWMQWLWMIR